MLDNEDSARNFGSILRKSFRPIVDGSYLVDETRVQSVENRNNRRRLHIHLEMRLRNRDTAEKKPIEIKAKKG